MEITSNFSDYNQFWIGCLIGFMILSYMHLTWDFDYWKNQGVPGEKPWLFIGTLKPLWKTTFQEQDVHCMKKYGHLHGGFIGTAPVLHVSDPYLVKQILVKDFPAFHNRKRLLNMAEDEVIGNMLSVMKGDKWKLTRNILSPTFTSGKLKQMVPLIEDCLQTVIIFLSLKVDKKETIDFTNIFPLLTLDVIASCAFGIKLNYIESPEMDFVINAQNAFRPNPILFYFMAIFPAVFEYIPKKLLPSQFRYFKTIGDQTINMRLKNKDFCRRDFLQIMLEAEIPEEGNDENKQNQSIGSKIRLTREVIVAQTILFLLAGYETTSNVINFIVFELANNLDIQEKLINEIDYTMKNSKGKLTYEDLASMQYLDMVVSEALRKYPPAVRLDRACTEDGYNFSGIILKKDLVVTIPVYAIHHNPEFYPDPNVFEPERFSPENKRKRNPFTYLPFGAGPRNCIATRFALMEIQLVVAHMLYNYRFQTCDETEFPITMLNNGITLLQPKSVKLKLQKRTDQLEFD